MEDLIETSQSSHPVPVIKEDKATQSVVIKVLPKNRTLQHETVGDDTDVYFVREVVNVHRLDPEVELRQPEVQQRTVLTSEASPSGGKQIITDDSLFPAWAIALVVLCVVILMVLIVLIIY